MMLLRLIKFSLNPHLGVLDEIFIEYANKIHALVFDISFDNRGVVAGIHLNHTKN